MVWDRGRFFSEARARFFSENDPHHWNEETFEKRLFISTVSAYGSALLAGKMLVAPLDRLKVHYQVAGCGLRSSAMQFGVLRTYWRGAFVHLFGSTLGVGSRLWAVPMIQLNLGVSRTIDRSPNWSSSVYGKLVLSSALASAIGVCVSHPLDVAYTSLAADTKHRYRGMTHCLREQIRARGMLSGPFRGIGLTLMTAFPFTAICVGVHDILSAQVLRRVHRPDWSPDELQPSLSDVASTDRALVLYPWNLIIGVASGLTAQLALYPLDTIRRSYMNLQFADDGKNIDRNPSVLRIIRNLRTNGGFYRGCGINTIKAIPELGVLCAGYFAVHRLIPH